ncbi:hypothetical protein STRAU_6830 [Streptomyces aurantiacus JA 4570]|uniref:Uncharacterized protein n=1 Tax=Streptomyces aurantiacus JA 4570 TaxID=1286094 RepID=S4AF81_9ACTN|nr:hypothetical protein STRAU_6830 [Streptomyces aurantiacus JA 4570]
MGSSGSSVSSSPPGRSTSTPMPFSSAEALAPVPPRSTPTSRAEAAPAAVSEAPAAITAPAAIRAMRIRVFFVIWLLPPVAESSVRQRLGSRVTGRLAIGPPDHTRLRDTHAAR